MKSIIMSSCSKSICFMFFSSFLVVGLSQISMAEESRIEMKKLHTASESAGKQRIFINPETGEIDPSPTPEAKASVAAQRIEIDEPVQEIYYQDDGSIRIDFNGKYMLPVYGRVNSDGSVSLSHDHPTGKE